MVDLYFRDGCLDAIGVRLLERGSQIAPLPAGWLRDNNKHITWTESRHLNGPPWELTLEGYSLALDWEHTIDIKVWID
jgi:hypothetical protein